MTQEQTDYVSVIYNEKEKPFTRYPELLTKYLFKRYNLKKDMKILDLGCGRGDFLKGFIKCELKGFGIDQSLSAQSICPGVEIKESNLGEEPLPYSDNSFDIVFSKSVLEHFYYPEKIIKEVYRILKPNGLVITMTPDWESVYKTFYEDYTHRTPFTKISMRNFLLIHGFKEAKVEKFRQLPFLWKAPWLNLFCALIAKISPSLLRKYSRFIRFSKEVMLLSTGIKN